MPKRSKKSPFNQIVSIGKQKIGLGYPCYIIAEAGSNHNGQLNNAKKLIDTAAIAKANAVKFQLFSPAKLYSSIAGYADYLGEEQSILDILDRMQMNKKWIPKLAIYCKQKKIDFLCSAFDEDAVDAIDGYVPAHKIASYEITHLPLIKHIAAKGKPIFLSTAMATLNEIDEALETISDAGNKNVILLHCIAAYPAPIESSNLRVIQTLQERYQVPVGLSDHSEDPFINPILSIGLGGLAIEKHFTLAKNLQGPDHRFAIEPHALHEMVTAIRKAESALGNPGKYCLPVEEELHAFARRHVHAIQDIAKGDILTTDNVAILRSGKATQGALPKEYHGLIGKRSLRKIKNGEGIRKRDVR